MSRILLMACSQRKRADPESLPAIERYDGPAFKVLRRYLRVAKETDLITHILSAEYGLIPSAESIPYYDRRMTRSRATELCPAVTRKLLSLIDENGPAEVVVCAGRTYLQALQQEGLPSNPPLRLVAGGQGQKLTNLKRWLHGDSG